MGGWGETLSVSCWSTGDEPPWVLADSGGRATVCGRRQLYPTAGEPTDMCDDAPNFELDQHAWGLAEAADAAVETVSVEELAAERDDPETIVLDVRDVRERWIEGAIPGDEHAPRGMVEFWADPETEYYHDFFRPGQRYVCYCNEGGRSAMVAQRLRQMGYPDVAHLAGGFTAWQAAAMETVAVEQRDYGER